MAGEIDILGLMYQTFIILVFIFFIIMTAIFLKNSIKEKREVDANPDLKFSKEHPLNLVLIIIILIFELIVIMIKVRFKIDGTPAQNVVFILAAVPFVIGILFIIVNIIQKIRGVKKVRRWGFACEKDELTDKQKKKIERQRKLLHLMYFFIITGFLFVSYYAFQEMAEANTIINNPTNYEQIQQNYEEFWGYTGGMDNINFIRNVFTGEGFVMSRSTLVLMFYGMSIVFLTVEFSRLSTRFHFLFQKSAQRNLRHKEVDTFASYTHMVAGYTFAAIMLPSLLFIATLSILCFADAAASIFGIRFGKHKIEHNGKSWEGTFAGFIFALFPVMIFAGPVYALVAAIGFAVTDVYTPKPITASDNILIPVVTSVLFIILSLLGIPSCNMLGIP